MIEIVVSAAILLACFAVTYLLKRYRRNEFDEYLKLHVASLNMRANTEWVLNGGIEKRYEIDREASFAKLEQTWFWDHAFEKMVVIK